MSEVCGHGISHNQQCDDCEIILLKESLEWLTNAVKIDKARLATLRSKNESAKQKLEKLNEQ